MCSSFSSSLGLLAIADFWDRLLRPGGTGRNITKVGQGTNPRDIASQIAAQARAAVDCPILQCIGPGATNQAIKAVAIARTYLSKSHSSGTTAHPDCIVYPEFVKLDPYATAPPGCLAAWLPGRLATWPPGHLGP